jgi:hypothetical protein
VSQVLHPSTLARFQELVVLMAGADTTGWVSAYLLGPSTPANVRDLTPALIFERALGTVIDDMPGLMHALYDRDDQVIGHVAEGADKAHVVYRSTARLSGAVPEVKVMQLTRAPGGWRVSWSDELDVLDAALRGVPRSGPRPPTPPPPA